MSTGATVPMFAPDGTLGDVPYERMQDAIKAGGKIGVNVKAPDGTPGVIPADRVQDAMKAGAAVIPIDPAQMAGNRVAPGESRDDIGNRIIVPKQGESFEDTMNRAADYGKTVTPAQIAAQAKQGFRDDAGLLAAAPILGAGGAAALAGSAEAAPILANLAKSPAGKFILEHAGKGAAFGLGGGAVYKLWRLLNGARGD